MNEFPRNVLVDSGYWIALLHPRDEHHETAVRHLQLLERVNVIVPWQCLYEVMNTRLARRADLLQQFERWLRRPHFIRHEDRDYRSQALNAVFRAATIDRRPMSLVDMVLRFIPEDSRLKLHAMLTFNPGDFADVCRRRRIAMLN